MNSVISSHKVKRTKNTFSLVLYSLYLVCVSSSLKCTLVSRGRSSLCRLRLAAAKTPAEVWRRVLQVQFALKKKWLFSSSHNPHVSVVPRSSPVCHPPWRTPIIGGVKIRPVGQGGGKDSNMLGEFYQSQPQWLSSRDIKLGMTVVTAANEKPCLLLPALCRGGPCCLPTESPLGRGLIQTAQRGGSVSLALMWRGESLSAGTVQNW